MQAILRIKQTFSHWHKRRQNFIIPLSLAAFIVSPCWAASSHDLIQIYDQARDYDAAFQENLLVLKARRHALNSSNSGLKPALTLSGDITHSRNDIEATPPNTEDTTIEGTSRVFAANVSQSLFDLERINQYQQGKVGITALKAETQLLEHNFLEQVSSVFFDALLAQDDVRLAQRQEKTLDQQLTQAQERFDVGLVSVTDVLEAQARLDSAEVDTLAAKNQLKIAQENLQLLTGQTITKLATLREDFPIEPPTPNTAADWIALANIHSPTLQLTRASLQQAKLQHRLARRAYLPSVNLVGRYASTQGFQSGFDQPDQVGSSVGLTLEMPLYLGGSISNAKREAEATRLAQRAAHTFEQRQLIRDINSRFDQVITDMRRVTAQLKSIRSNASALEATQAGYVAGIRNSVDVLLAQQQLITAERNYAESRYDYLKGKLALQARAGVLDREALVKINQGLTTNASPPMPAKRIPTNKAASNREP